MNPRFAILDLGTNTFHLLIAEVKPDRAVEILHRDEEYVKLGEEGLARIGENAFMRGVSQVARYKMVMDLFQPAHVVGVGTAAIRKASNGDAFIRAVKDVCPMALRKISGDEEAALIYRGVKEAVTLDEQPILIMDIGGGSTEFIIANSQEIFWKQSFPVGGSVLHRKFHRREPIGASEQVCVINHLQEELRPLFEQLDHWPVRHLVGASGSFDCLARLIAENIFEHPLYPFESATDIPMREFFRLCQQMIALPLDARLKMNGMLWFRAEMMPVSAILAGFVVETAGIKRITRSAFSLKEGLMMVMADKLKAGMM